MEIYNRGGCIVERASLAGRFCTRAGAEEDEAVLETPIGLVHKMRRCVAESGSVAAPPLLTCTERASKFLYSDKGCYHSFTADELHRAGD